MPQSTKKIAVWFCCLIIILSSALCIHGRTAPDVPWQDRLYTPTSIISTGKIFMIIDCWHHRALWSEELAIPISRWKTVDDDLAGPHSVATNGDIFVIDDTERGGVRVYRHVGTEMKLVQKLDDFRGRTHRVHYSNEHKAFYVLSSGVNTISKLMPDDANLLKIDFSKKLDFLGQSYTRSFTLHEDYAYFVSGPDKITQTLLKDDSFSVVRQFEVAPELFSMNDIFYSGNYWYITATPQRIVRVKDLSQLTKSPLTAIDIYYELGLKGTPYYMSYINGRLFVPQITEYSGLVSFIEDGDKIADVRVDFEFGPPSVKSVQRKQKYIK